VNITLLHEGNDVREFYSKLPRPVRVGIVRSGIQHRFAPTPHVEIRSWSVFTAANWSRKGLGKASVAMARKLGIRLWITLRDEIDYHD